MKPALEAKKMDTILPPFDPSKLTPINTKSAGIWAHQLFGQFPNLSTATLTSEFVEAVKSVLGVYPEGVIARACNPVYGIASKAKFFPSLAELKSLCDDAAFEISERFRREKLAAKKSPREPYSDVREDDRPSYTGPIENIKPGDVLNQSRFPEYREFMKNKKGIPNIKMWGRHEDWEDNKHRPFGGGWEPPKPILPPSEKEKKVPVAWALSKEALAAKHGISVADIDAIPNQKDYDWKKPALNIQKEPNPFDP